MPGKRVSLVCAGGMLLFIFRDGYVVKVLGEGRYALSSNSVCMAKMVLIFKPDTIIINHQLELSGTRVKYMDHEKRAYKHEILVLLHIRKSLL